ncbi:hypothetical protein SEA_AMORE2_54 [Gordonia phage Amore2]|uniref:Uncharacterized protein n=2 Tax=Getseptimavirus TaxID=2560139 RepID=G8FS35_9CAUD|nr:hypothetical protein GTE7_gp042 [Gordonia phage GTE7]AER26585.1 hypothetical protein [Gordonia phage GTE7]USH44869.1 hypothetical protein SEA_AMORE2_54 [Gordonia phage Amore2]
MGYSKRERLGMFLQRFEFLDRFILKYDGVMNNKIRYVNKISGHIVTRESKK